MSLGRRPSLGERHPCQQGGFLLVLTPRWSEQNTERMDRLLQRLGIPLQSANRDRGDVSGMDAGDHDPGVIQRVGERVTIELTLGRMHAHVRAEDVPDIGMLTASRMRVHGFPSTCGRGNSCNQRCVSNLAQCSEEAGYLPLSDVGDDLLSAADHFLGRCQLQSDRSVIDLCGYVVLVGQRKHPAIDHLWRRHITADYDSNSPSGMRPKAQGDIHDWHASRRHRRRGSNKQSSSSSASAARRRPIKRLLVGDGGAGGLEGLASLVRSLLVDLLQNGLRRCLDEILGLLEPEAGE
jgi:hypothetical protein